MKKLLTSGLALSIALLTSGCFKEKNIPAEQLITIYDSNIQETNKIAPLETMFVKVAGLEPNALHRVEVLDPNQKIITYAEVRSNDQGIIGPLPIWYDVGIEKKEDGSFGLPNDELSLKSFYIRVKSLNNSDTDFKQDFFLLLKKPSNPNDMPKPVVSSVSVEDGNISNAKLENTFLETGSKTPDGEDSNLTKVYVKANLLPYHTIKDGKIVPTDKVDIYVIPFTGVSFEDGLDLEAVAVTSRKNVETIDKQTYKTLPPTLIWDLNRDPKLINPGDSNNAYSIIIDTNQNGRLDIGEDLDGDGKYDRYIDGIDGQGAAGFIVMNTEANELDYYMSDDNKNRLDTISENESGDKTHLYLNMNNIPTTEKNATIYVVDEDAADLPDGYNLSDNDVREKNEDETSGTNAKITPPDNETRFMPYIAWQKVITTQNEAGYGYTEDITEPKKLDVVVDLNKNGQYDKGVDYYLANAVTILPYDTNITTVVDEEGREITSVFNEANSESNTTVYIKFGENNGGECSNTHYAYLFKKDAAPKEGDELFGEIIRVPVYTDNNCVTKFMDTTELFKKEILKIVNPNEKNNKYVIIVDKDDNHRLNSDGDDKILNIAFKDTPANELPDVSYINLASGGLMGQPYQHWVDTPYTSAYDYRDVFTVDAEDTVPTEWWWTRYWMDKGVKVVWNPYIRDRGWWWWRHNKTYINEKGEESDSPFYYGQIVDLYIIPADKYSLYKNMPLSDKMDIRGRHTTLPIQFSCRNGVNLQTIWKAPLKVGKYYVIVDANRNGKVDDGVDFIDAVKQDGTTIKDNPDVVGFSVVE